MYTPVNGTDVPGFGGVKNKVVLLLLMYKMARSKEPALPESRKQVICVLLCPYKDRYSERTGCVSLARENEAGAVHFNTCCNMRFFFAFG